VRQQLSRWYEANGDAGNGDTKDTHPIKDFDKCGRNEGVEREEAFSGIEAS